MTAVGILLQRCAQGVAKFRDQPVEGRLAAPEFFHEVLSGYRGTPLAQNIVQVIELFSPRHRRSVCLALPPALAAGAIDLQHLARGRELRIAGEPGPVRGEPE